MRPQRPLRAEEMNNCGGNQVLVSVLGVGCFSFGVRDGMFYSFDDSSFAALAPLTRINYKVTPK